MQPFRIKDSHGRQEFSNLPTFCGKQFIKKDQSSIIYFIDKMNGIQVTNFYNRSTEPFNYRMYAQPQSIKQESKTTRVL